jgi:hypothetical protein
MKNVRLELSSTLKIRDKEATIKQLEFPKDTPDKFQQLVSANVAEDVRNQEAYWWNFTLLCLWEYSYV